MSHCCAAESGNHALHDLPRGFTSLYPVIRDSGADVTAINHAGFTPMHCAAARADVPLARLLLRDSSDAAGGAAAVDSLARASSTSQAPGTPSANGGGSVMPAMSARSVAMVQSLAASGAAATAEDRRNGSVPDTSPDVVVRAPPPPPPLRSPPLPSPRAITAKALLALCALTACIKPDTNPHCGRTHRVHAMYKPGLYTAALCSKRPRLFLSGAPMLSTRSTMAVAQVEALQAHHDSAGRVCYQLPGASCMT